MHVELMGWTTTTVSKELPWQEGVTSRDALGEFAGRACYQSFDRPNPKTAKNSDYLANIIKQQHESVLEHSSATFYITGVSRSLTHELVRHRHLSFSQQSQRYVDESEAAFVEPPLFAELERTNSLDTSEGTAVLDAMNRIGRAAEECREAYAQFVEAAQAVGVKRKQAREAARAILPNGTETRIVVTGNLRAWRDFLRKRHTPHADAEIRALACRILGELKSLAPNSFQDFEECTCHAS